MLPFLKEKKYDLSKVFAHFLSSMPESMNKNMLILTNFLKKTDADKTAAKIFFKSNLFK